MTTAPSLPNLPTEEMIEAGLAQAYPHLTGVQPGDIVRIWQAMVIAAPKPSPQESHKLAEELERLAADMGVRHFTLWRDRVLAVAAALRSSPSEYEDNPTGERDV